MRLPVDVMDLVKSTGQINAEREKPVRIALFVEIDTPDRLVEAAQRAFRAYASNAYLHIEVAEPGVKLVVDPAADAVIGLVGSCGAAIADSLQAARERAIPTVVLALAEDSSAVADRLDHPYRDTLADGDEVRLVDLELGDWLVERVPAKRLALAHNYAFMRRAVAVEHVKNTAMQNGIIGVVAFIPGTDMPIMTANQAKMLLQIAAAYGENLGAERAKELLAIVGGGFVFRTIARQAIAFVPGFGWAIKGGIGYSGTIAMGYAAIKYFEKGVDLGDLEDRLKEYGRGIGAKLSGMSRKDARRLAEESGLDVTALGTALPAAEVQPELPAAAPTSVLGPAETGETPDRG